MTNHYRAFLICSLLTMFTAQAQSEEPDWQDRNTHFFEYEGTKFPKEAAEAVLKAVLYGKSTVTFTDIDNDHINELVLDTVEGYPPGWEKGDRTFEITKHRTVFYYGNGKVLADGPIPGQ